MSVAQHLFQNALSEFDHFIGTGPVSGKHAFDVEWALTCLALDQNLEGFAGPLTELEMFKGGQSNPTYKLITPRRSYVMRAKPGPVCGSCCPRRTPSNVSSR